MNYTILGIVFSTLLLGSLPAHAESYNLQIDEHSYDIQYDVDADVLAMAIDQELNSLLIGLENTQDSLFTIQLDDEMISAENNEFAILVDGFEVNYEANPMGEKTEIKFFVPIGTQEVEIIGTHVIPEFSTVMIILLVLISGVILVTKRPIFGLK